MLKRLLPVFAVAAALGACATETRVVVASDDACTAYGFRIGTAAYDQCRAREYTARQQSRAVMGYSEAQILADSQTACRSYGLVPYSGGYDACVQREYAARRPV
jgi:hypothetical protein